MCFSFTDSTQQRVHATGRCVLDAMLDEKTFTIKESFVEDVVGLQRRFRCAYVKLWHLAFKCTCLIPHACALLACAACLCRALDVGLNMRLERGRGSDECLNAQQLAWVRCPACYALTPLPNAEQPWHQQQRAAV